MIIDKRQMKAFSSEAANRFESRQIAHLRARFPQQTAGAADAQIRQFVREGRARAEKRGVDAEDDIERFLEFRVIHGLEYDERCDWANRIFTIDGVSGTKKMDWIDDHDQFVLNRPL